MRFWAKNAGIGGYSSVTSCLSGVFWGIFAHFFAFLRVFWEKWGGSLRFFGGEISRS
jgi:hypothetical protein